MLDFGCRTFDMDQLLKCGLGLTKAELSVLHFLLRNCRRQMSSQEISDGTGFDLSTIQKAVKKLHARKTLSRFQRNLDSGGYLFLYMCNSRQEIRDALKGTVRSWVRNVESAIDRW